MHPRTRLPLPPPPSKLICNWSVCCALRNSLWPFSSWAHWCGLLMVNTVHQKSKPRATAVKTEADFPGVWLVLGLPSENVYFGRWERFLPQLLITEFCLTQWWFQMASMGPSLQKSPKTNTLQVQFNHVTACRKPIGRRCDTAILSNISIFIWPDLQRPSLTDQSGSCEVAVIDPVLRAALLFAWRLPSTCSHIQMSLSGKQFSVAPIGSEISKMT